MSDSANNQAWLISEFADRLAVVLEAMTGVRPPIEAREVVLGSPPANELILDQALQGLPTASIPVRASEASWMLVGSTILKAAGLDEINADTSRSTFLETIAQASASVCQAISARIGHEITCQAPVSVTALPVNTVWIELSLSLDGSAAVVHLGVVPALIDALTTEPKPQNQQPPASASLTAGVDAPASTRTLDLLFDVELPVSVSFGRAQLPLKDVIKLTTGSIVELNRAISEPVEIIVNNCVIARGDVVVVEGNFGVRIQQVISRQERLRTLT